MPPIVSAARVGGLTSERLPPTRTSTLLLLEQLIKAPNGPSLLLKRDSENRKTAGINLQTWR